MLDQSFSAENFRKIISLENRKGLYLEGEFFPDIASVSYEIKKCNIEIRDLKKSNLPKIVFLSQLDVINTRKEEFKSHRESLYEDVLSRISSSVSSSKYKLDLESNTDLLDKPVYKVKRTIENILALKQLQYNFGQLYKVKQANRYSIVSQLKMLLGDGFPKVIVRTDIKSFYESIPQEKLIRKINNDNLLTHTSKKFIQQIISRYNEITGERIGIPRGIGISAYLSELFMRNLDDKIRSLPSVIYYARYVDDIVVLFMPNLGTNVRDYKQEIKDLIIDEGLVMNEASTKTNVINLVEMQDVSYELEYLGYCFSSGQDIVHKPGKLDKRNYKPLEVSISERKRIRYENRLTRAFDIYNKDAKRNEKKSRKIFLKRIRFLMGNTKLKSSKKNISTGVFYNNSLITNTKEFEDLDKKFEALINQNSYKEALNEKLRRCSFINGFSASKISVFSYNDLENIMKNWML